MKPQTRETNDKKGVAYHEGARREGYDHKPQPSTPDPRRAVCTVCGTPVHYRRRTYGPNGQVGRWQHTGDSLAQARSYRR